MATKQATAVARTVDLDPIDRLEEKVRMLVDTVTQLRAEQSKAMDENARLTSELDSLRARLADAETVSVELASLKDERETIRTRVADMLAQLESI